MNIFWILGLIVSQSSVASTAVCDVIYELRPVQIEKAITCYQNLATTEAPKGQTLLRMQALEKWAEAASWIAVKGADKSERQRYIASGKDAADELVKSFPQQSSGYYWRAVYLSRDVREKDEGVLIPRDTLRAIPAIKKDLQQAMNLGPEVHGFGPNRVYGIIFAEMPAAVGGDKKVGEANLRKAYDQASRFSANAVELGKFYRKEKRFAEAKSVLAEIVQLLPEQFDPSRIPETRDDQIDAQKIWNAIP